MLAGLGPDDARDAFAAIALASPGGLGTAEEADVRSPPTTGLVEAMRLAGDRDLVARQYASGFADIFGVGLPAALAADDARAGAGLLGRAFAGHVAFATRFPDSHVGRKFGAAAAESLRLRMAGFAAEIVRERSEGAVLERALTLDSALKAEGLNPGTTADLTVTSLFAANLAEGLRG